MSLAPGAHVGPYEVVEPLGEGGMGQVWKAKDLRLQREVALKVLPDGFAADAERLARFERESQILASLNHPHIATIHGVEDGPSGLAIVMELVPGMTLDTRIGQGPLPLPEALAIARDVADALETAHEHGVVHRDLKPGNLKLTAAGRVKVLDFGLAKAGTGASAVDMTRSPTMMNATAAGTLIGTAAYMSPEQARGDAVDRRTDVWAFGCVLYEMLTGRPSFDGRSVVDVLGAIVRADPDWSALPPPTPALVRRLLEQCLRKNPRDRLRDIGDARIALEDVIAGRDAAPVVPSPLPGRLSSRAHVAWALAAIAALGVGAWASRRIAPAAPVLPLRKLEISIPDPVLSTFTRPALAPDGHAVAYGASHRLWVRRFDHVDARELPGTIGGERPFWSPDATQIAFALQRKLWKVIAEGGDPVPVCDLPGNGRIIAGVWRPDGVMVFSSWFGAVYQVPASGGDPTVLIPNTDARDFHELSLLPDGRTLIFVPHARVRNLATIEALRGGQRTVIVPAQPIAQYDVPRYSPSGHLLYVRQTTNDGVWAVAFSPETLQTTGEPFRVAAGPWLMDAAADGTLMYSASTMFHELRWVDRTGVAQGTIGQPLWQLQQAALSPNGRFVVVSASESPNAAANDRRLWIYDTQTGMRERPPSSTDLTNDMAPEWSPDGRYIASDEVRRSPPAIVCRRVGSGQRPRLLVDGVGRPSFAPDGSRFAFTRVSERTAADVWIAPFAEGTSPGPPEVILNGPANEESPRFSPDGRFLAYESDETGRPEIYLQRFPITDERWQISNGGGVGPLWNKAGSELFYRTWAGTLIGVRTALGASVAIGEPRELFTEQSSGIDLASDMDVSADGQRFVVVARTRGSSARLTVVQNWASEFVK